MPIPKTWHWRSRPNRTTTVPEDESDPAAEAFARLEGELALMRRAVQHLAAERADIVIPDYGATLSEMTKRLAAVSRSVDAIADHPAMQLTPDSIRNQIAALAESARRTDQDRISQARYDLHHATQEMRSVTAHARTAADQRQQLVKVAGGALLAGILLWSFLPGTIARAMPESWHWPERMAQNVLDEPTHMDAGIHLIRSENPKAWDAIRDSTTLFDANRRAIGRCKNIARKTGQPTNCMVRVER